LARLLYEDEILLVGNLKLNSSYSDLIEIDNNDEAENYVQ
jgi:hypothetical protein